MNLSLWLRNLKKKLFADQDSKLDVDTAKTIREVKEATSGYESQPEQTSKKRDPYFIQIGFDFGTSYSKCICRDVMTNKAWVHIPDVCREQELPFLIPSTILLKDGILSNDGHSGNQYPENGMYHLKPALVKVALGEWTDEVLEPYRDRVGSLEPNRISDFVQNCAIYFLAGALGEVKAQIRKRFSDFGYFRQDYMAVNLAIPVADAERPKANDLFQRILEESWGLADRIHAHPQVNLNDLVLMRRENKERLSDITKDACFIYPEVSANVQGFVRSRVSRTGMYLFSDTGASTVDQSVFIYFKRNGEEDHLTYLHGSVLPLGSSHIEQRAAVSCGKLDCSSLETWRIAKETGGAEPELQRAREWVATNLSQGTTATLAFAKKKLYVKDQLNETRLIFGGGGHCDYPYRSAVLRPFSGPLFRDAVIPDIVGLPVPRDMELKESEARWMRRLSVAYGLSFEKSELTNFTYPKDVSTPTSEEIWSQRKYIRNAPSKDEC